MIRYQNIRKKPRFKEVSYEQAIGTAVERGFSYAGVYRVDDESGSLVENTLIPPFYRKYSEKRQTRTDRNKKYYRLGEDNHYPFFLLDLKSKSNLLSAAADSSSHVARGSGAKPQSENKDHEVRFTNWLKRIKANLHFEQMLFANLGFFRGAYVEMAFGDKMTDDAKKMKRLTSIKAGNYIRYRVGVRNAAGKIPFYYFHPDFYCSRPGTARLRAIKPYIDAKNAFDNIGKNTVFKHDGKDPFFENGLSGFNKGRFVHFIKEPSLLSEEYPRATFETESCLNAIVLNALLSQFDVAGMENGLTLGHIVTVPLAKPRRGDKEGEERYEKRKREFREIVRQRFQGADNENNILVLYQDPRSKNDPVTIAQVPHNNTKDTLEDKDERAERTILTAFKVPHPQLIGVAARTSKGLNQQSGTLTEADNQWYTDFVSKITIMAENFYNEVLVPIWQLEENIETTDLKVVFPRNIRYKHVPP